VSPAMRGEIRSSSVRFHYRFERNRWTFPTTRARGVKTQTGPVTEAQRSITPEQFKRSTRRYLTRDGVAVETDDETGPCGGEKWRDTAEEHLDFGRGMLTSAGPGPTTAAVSPNGGRSW